jgi:hypothetical protein
MDDRSKGPIQFVLYGLLRHEQALAAGAEPAARSEIARILDLAQMAYGELVGLLIGRADGLLDTTRDGEWSLRDLLRHAIAVELRYAAQVEYAAIRPDEDPLAIPDERLPCDRLSPPEPEYAYSRTGGLIRMLELLGQARQSSYSRLSGNADAVLERPSLWGRMQITVRMRLHQVAAHLFEVAIQSEKMLGVDASGTEARRILRRCSAMRGLHENWSELSARGELDARYRRLAEAL